MHADLLIYLALVIVIWIAFMARKHRAAGRKPRLGDAEAYDGNLIIPPPGGRPDNLAGYGSHGSHIGHGGSHIGHAGQGDGHVGHGAVGGHH